METILTRLLEVSLSFILLFFCVILIRKAFHKQISAALQYAVWGLLLLRLLLPVGFSSGLSPWNLLSTAAAPQSSVTDVPPAVASADTALLADSENAGLTGEPVLEDKNKSASGEFPVQYIPAGTEVSGVSPAVQTDTQKPASDFSWQTLVFMLLAVGAVLRAVWLLCKSFILRRNIYLHGSPVPEHIGRLVRQIKVDLHIRRSIDVAMLGGFPSPAVLGVFHPVLILPDSLCGEQDMQRIEHVLVHELVHIKRMDTLFITLLNILSAVYWFNPFVWWAFRLMREDMETVCDTAVLKSIGADKRNGYIQTVLYFASQGHAGVLTAGASINDGKMTMQKRIQGMYRKPRTGKPVLALVSLLLAVFTFAAFTTACGTAPVLENAPAAQASPGISESARPSPSASAANTENAPDPAAANISANLSDQNSLADIVNIMLIGVDYASERETWSGKKAYHADAMAVLSVNTKTNNVHLISLPRDTYANIPGVKGIYRLNAAIDCGGGWPKASGFEKVCESASWMLGGIPVKYYYAVDLNAIKGLVEVMGGVEYDLDVDFQLQGRTYKKGMQHMNGQAVLDYLRVRKNVSAGSSDLGRIERQKKMLVTLFKKLKESGTLSKLPDILKSFKGNLYTNAKLEQTAALSVFFSKIDPASVKLHTMDGTLGNAFGRAMLFTDQKMRVALLKEVYGVDVPPEDGYTLEAAQTLWADMVADTVVSRSAPVLEEVKKKLDAGESGSSVRALYDKANKEFTELSQRSGMAADAVQLACEQLEADIEKLCKTLSVKAPSWNVDFENTTNEVKVDFR